MGYGYKDMLTVSSAEAMHDAGSDCGNRVSRAIASSEIVIRAATARDIVEFYGELPSGTMRAMVAVMDDEVVGVIGIVREQLWGKFFSDSKPKLQPHLKSITIMRAIKRSLKFCDDYRGRVLAVAKDAESCRLMHRLGFTHLYGGWYGWLG